VTSSKIFVVKDLTRILIFLLMSLMYNKHLCSSLMVVTSETVS
jgi:hypothetical protein